MKALQFLFLTVLLFSCTAARYYDTQILEIPGKRNENQNAIPVYFTGQTPELKPYLKMVELRVAGKGTVDNRIVSLIMKSKAIENGLDAVIDVSFSYYTEEYTSFMDILISSIDKTEAYYSGRDVYQITGIGIKFLDNLDYFENLPEYENIFILKGKRKEPFLDLELKPTGDIYQVNYHHSYSNTFYRNYIFEHTDYHLLEERNGWKYKMTKPDLKKRKLYSNGKLVKTCLIHYDSINRVESVAIKFTIVDKTYAATQNISLASEEVKYYYDEKNLLNKKEISYYDKSRLVIYPVYGNNKLKGYNYELYRNDQLWLKLSSVYRFYSKDYLKGFYQHLSDSTTN